MKRPLKFRLDHTMIRVADLEQSLDFYVRILGMSLLRRNDYPDGRFTNVFVGFGPENETTTLELTYNWDTAVPYEKGSGYGHLAFNVENVTIAMEYLEHQGVTIKSPAKAMNHGTRMLGFVLDPDGYIIELNEPIIKTDSC
jgi:lactoylglutathione lyase